MKSRFGMFGLAGSLFDSEDFQIRACKFPCFIFRWEYDRLLHFCSGAVFSVRSLLLKALHFSKLPVFLTVSREFQAESGLPKTVFAARSDR